jgi:hypothetical protein
LKACAVAVATAAAVPLEFHRTIRAGPARVAFAGWRSAVRRARPADPSATTVTRAAGGGAGGTCPAGIADAHTVAVDEAQLLSERAKSGGRRTSNWWGDSDGTEAKGRDWRRREAAKDVVPIGCRASAFRKIGKGLIDLEVTLRISEEFRTHCRSSSK